jgi:hypothetical protein
MSQPLDWNTKIIAEFVANKQPGDGLDDLPRGHRSLVR